MIKNRCLVILVVVLCGFQNLHAQYFGFRTEPDEFAIDVVKNLNTLGTEGDRKVAYDFKSMWGAKITNTQKDSIILICLKMNERRLPTKPYFRYFFSLATYALGQSNLSTKEFSIVLNMCHKSVNEYNKREILSVFKSLSFFFARGYIYTSHYNKLTSTGGSFSLEQIAAVEPTKPTDIEPEEKGEDEYIEEEDLNSGDEWASDDDWGDNDSDDDGWGNDNWDTDDSWGSDESYGYLVDETEKKEEARKVYVFEKPDLVALAKSNDIDPILEGPVIKVSNMDFTMATPYDTLTIKNVSGSIILKNHMFVGAGGTIEWPAEHRVGNGAVVELKNYSFDIEAPVLNTTRAEMTFPGMYEGTIPGEFKFKSGKRYRGEESHYPQFTSWNSNVKLNLPGQGIKYDGGISLVGGKMYGTSVSKELSTLQVTGKDDRSFTSKAVKYEFNDSTIRSKRASLVIYHGQDSIYHPVVGVDFDAAVPLLRTIKDEGGYKHTYYYSSFFKMEFKADMIEWDLNADSLDISILNAGNIVPAVFESEEYFNPIRYKKMTGLFGFHPIMLVVSYARKVQDSHYNIMELVDEYGFKPKQVTSAIKFAEQNGYVKFNQESGAITVLRKAYHYVMSNAKRKDFDNILISSVAPQGGKNATLDFINEEMYVRGIRRVNITPDTDVFVEPEEGVLTLLEDKDMKFTGMINAGDFKYYGKGSTFKYDEYLVEMPEIDSIDIQVDFHETEDHEKSTLGNHLERTSGTLYINHPKNKAGLKKNAQYPYFISDSEAIVYFNTKETLNGAYDRSIYFVIPPFEIDSINREDAQSIGFEGTFYSGIVPPIKETLKIMPDKSLGFVHDIPTQGYSLYQGEGVLYNQLSLNYDGLRSNGRIDYRTTTVNSDDFVFYMDSVSAVGQEGKIRAGSIDAASYPQAELKGFKMLWLPLKDSMYIANTGDPFQFYEATASLDGKANITAGGVYGSGTMLSRGSKSTSDRFHFSEFEYSGRHADFEILTDNPDKPAMAGDDVEMNFDLKENIAYVHPEQVGVAAIQFPYSQMKTSITNAIWYLDSAKVAMSKPSYVDIMSSYFYTTRKELDSLAFNATGAVYDMNTYELNIKGIPYIKVADAEIIPDNNETTILENSALQPFDNAKLKIDTLNQYHNLYDGNITILSRNKFIGHATYEVLNSAKEMYAIEFAEFNLMEVERDGKKKLMTVSGGVITPEENIKLSPGFFYEGTVTMYADQASLQKKGLVSLDMKSLGRYDYWVKYSTPGDTADVEIKLADTQTEDGAAITAGILNENETSEMYLAFVREKHSPEDTYFFEAEGILSYDKDTYEFKIEEENKRSGGYAGKSFVYNDNSRELNFDGALDLIENVEGFKIRTAVVGSALPDSNTYKMDAMIAMDMTLHKDIVDEMTKDIEDIVERLGSEVAHKNGINEVIKLANFIGDEDAKEYENNSLSDYEPLVETSNDIISTLFFSNIDLEWSDEYMAWYNTSKIGLSHIQTTDINAESDGFMEIRKDEDGYDVVHLFFQLAPSTWYFFSYEHGRLLIYSSNPEFNNLITEHSTVEKTGFGEYTSVLGDEFEVIKFVDGFRRKYYNIDEPYNLEFPDETHLEDDEDAYETIEDVDGDLEEDHSDTFEDHGDTAEETIQEEEEPIESEEEETEQPVGVEEEDDGF